MHCSRRLSHNRILPMLGLILCLVYSAQSVSAAESVQSLRYGVGLYYFYQQDFFNALSELMIGQQRDELGVHTDNAELLKGGMSLSYGMDIQAEHIFSGFVAQPRQSAASDRAWFYLAKMAQQRQQWARSAAAMDNIVALSATALRDELNYMRAELNSQHGNFQKAGEYLSQLPADSAWLPYYYYNMGAQQAAAENWSEAAHTFRHFEQLEVRTEEAKSLRDRAYTASGFAFMATGDYVQASRDFTRVRLNSPLADRALLGYGWAASAQQDYLAALSPWQSLGEKPAHNLSARESLLAIPYAYEKLGREGVALDNYQSAANVFAKELERVKTAIDELAQAELQELLGLNQPGNDDWLFGADILPLNPQAPWLSQLVSSHDFQNALKELRDLHQLERRLTQNRQRLNVLAAVDTDQQDNWARLIEQDRQQELRQRLADAQRQAADLQHKLASARQQADGRAVADSNTLALWRRLEHAAVLAAELDAEPAQRQRIEFLRGLLIWQDNEQFPELLWENRLELKRLRAAVEQATVSLGRLDETIDGRQQASFAPRISSLQVKLSTQQKRLELALIASTSHVRSTATAELQQHAVQLARSLAQSKLAIARLYDKGSMGAQL